MEKRRWANMVLLARQLMPYSKLSSKSAGLDWSLSKSESVSLGKSIIIFVWSVWRINNAN